MKNYFKNNDDWAYAIIVILMLFFTAISVNGQTVQRKGNTFSVSSSRNSVKDTLKTKYLFSDKKGNTYPIIINRQNGYCYVYKVSKKSGKPYRQPMKEEICREICKEMNIPYTYKKRTD